MTSADRLLQRWRISKVGPYLKGSTRVLDIGSADGALFQRYPFVDSYVGVDPDVVENKELGPNARMLRGFFPAALDSAEPFDVITLLAVLEHVPPKEQVVLAAECARWLRPGGRLIVTVPSPVVDVILGVLKALRIVDGMSVEQHYGFDARLTPAIFEKAGLRLVRASRFQLGVNNLFVFGRA